MRRNAVGSGMVVVAAVCSTIGMAHGADGGNARAEARVAASKVPLEGLSTLRAAQRMTATDASRLAPRRGGLVHLAWPRTTSASRPDVVLMRWLAMQTGRDRTPAAMTSGLALDPSLTLDGATSLQLVRSFSIPVDDPDAVRLENLAFTYDSALAARAYVASQDRAQAEQLLDQLQALQRTDGSIEYAYDTKSGDSAPVFRTGTHALVGIAALAYADKYRSTRYLKLITGVRTWLLAQQSLEGTPATGYGLLRGGPDVKWMSTQHNLLAWLFFRGLVNKKGDESDVAAQRIAAGIESALLVRSGAESWFRQGRGDDVRALDAQALGILYLAERNETAAREVAATTRAQYRITGRVIRRSTDLATYNDTYESKETFTGYRPYAIGVVDAPDVLWAEGTAQMRFANKLVGRSDPELDASINRWTYLTGKLGRGPLGADITVTGNALNEYHVWPYSAAASWTMLAVVGDPLVK